MNRQLNLFLILCFFSVQLFSLLHTTEHALKGDQHNEQQCAHYQHLKNSSAPGNSAVNLTQPVDLTAISKINLPNPPFTKPAYRHSIASRAPPAFA